MRDQVAHENLQPKPGNFNYRSHRLIRPMDVSTTFTRAMECGLAAGGAGCCSISLELTFTRDTHARAALRAHRSGRMHQQQVSKKNQVNDVSEYFFFSDRLAYFHDVMMFFRGFLRSCIVSCSQPHTLASRQHPNDHLLLSVSDTLEPGTSPIRTLLASCLKLTLQSV